MEAHWIAGYQIKKACSIEIDSEVKVQYFTKGPPIRRRSPSEIFFEYELSSSAYDPWSLLDIWLFIVSVALKS